MTFITIATFVNPVCVMTFVYWNIFIVARSHARKIVSQSTQCDPDGSGHTKRRLKRELKGGKTLTIIMGTHFLCWRPLFVFYLVLLKHWKIRVALRQWCSNFPWRERKPNYGNKNRKLRIRPLVKSFLAAENEKRQLEDLPRADFGHLPERFLLVGTKSITENLYIFL